MATFSIFGGAWHSWHTADAGIPLVLWVEVEVLSWVERNRNSNLAIRQSYLVVALLDRVNV